MSTEAAAQVEPTPAVPSTPTDTSPAVDVVHDVSGAVERQRVRLAAAKGAAPPAAAPPSVPAKPAPALAQQPAAGSTEIEIDVPDEQALLEEARKRLAEREQRAPLDSVAAKLAAMEERLQQLPAGPAIPIAALKGSDPAATLAALRDAGVDLDALTKTLARAKLAPSIADQFGALIDAKLAPLMERIAPAQQQQQQQAPVSYAQVIDQEKGAYAEYIQGAAGRWPYLDAKREELGPEMVADLVFAYTTRLHQSGVDTSRLSNEQLSAMFVKKYAPAGASPPGAPSASGGPPAKSPGTSSASGGPTRTSAPRTVTAGLAANAGPAKPPANDQERFARAVERQRARLKQA